MEVLDPNDPAAASQIHPARLPVDLPHPHPHHGPATAANGGDGGGGGGSPGAGTGSGTGGTQGATAGAGNFTVVSQRRTVQQLATGNVIDVQAIGFQTVPHGVYCEALIPLADWTNGNSAAYINPLATAIETIMSSQPVSSASFVQDVDPATNLLADFEDFIVSYSPPGARATMTTTVRVSVGQLAQGAAGLPTALIQAAYATLQHTAGL